MSALESAVHESLNHAIANGYELMVWSDEEIAADLADYDASFEGIETPKLIEHVATWRQAQPLQYFCDRRRHLVCVPYSVDNLHEMARRLGIKRHWFHGGRHPHYDLPKRQADAISSRCVVTDSRAILRIIQTGEPPT